MSAGDVSFIRGEKSNINDRVNTDGDILLSTDTEELFVKTPDKTIKVSDFIILTNEAAREAIISPLEKLYFVKSTGNLWFYSVSTQWWMLINTGETTLRNINLFTFPPALGSTSQTGGQLANWNIQMTILPITEKVYLSEDTNLGTIFTQLSDDNSAMLAIYRFNYNTQEYHLVCNTSVIAATLGEEKAYIINIEPGEETINTTDLYYFAVITNSSNNFLAGSSPPTTNTIPYSCALCANAGDLSQATKPPVHINYTDGNNGLTYAVQEYNKSFYGKLSSRGGGNNQ